MLILLILAIVIGVPLIVRLEDRTRRRRDGARVICSRCKADMGGTTAAMDSHGICDRCLPAEMEKAAQAAAKSGGKKSILSKGRRGKAKKST